MTMTLSYHAEYERADRLARLEEVLGFTNVVLEAPCTERGVRYCITSSGILIVKNLFTDVVVTAYLINMKQCAFYCRMAGKSCVPPKLEKRVRKNMERHQNLYFI